MVGIFGLCLLVFLRVGMVFQSAVIFLRFGVSAWRTLTLPSRWTSKVLLFRVCNRASILAVSVGIPRRRVWCQTFVSGAWSCLWGKRPIHTSTEDRGPDQYIHSIPVLKHTSTQDFFKFHTSTKTFRLIHTLTVLPLVKL